MSSDAALKVQSPSNDGRGPLFLRRPVPAALRGLVHQIVAYDEGGVPLVLAPEFAALVFPLCLNFGEPFEIGLGRPPRSDERWTSFTAGLFPGCVLINSTGRARCIQIDLTPLGASCLFQMPLAELAGRIVGLDDLPGRQLDGLCQRLGMMSGWEQRLDAAIGWLTPRLLAAEPAPPQIEAAWKAIVTSGGAMRVGILAERVGWSRKHLVRRFHDEIGLPPKTVARMARFHRAIAIAGRDRTSQFAGIAHECGYADQAHFNREFAEFTGRTPGEWRASLG